MFRDLALQCPSEWLMLLKNGSPVTYSLSTEAAEYSLAARQARDYYNGDDANAFYSEIWGSEDIHIGLYESGSDDIPAASRETVRRMVSVAQKLSSDSRVLDLGSGYGGAARLIATEFASQVNCLDISEANNDQNSELTVRAELDHLIQIHCGSFEDIPFEAATFDVVWSQDAIVHSGNRKAVMREVARVLRPGGEFVFTDIMQSDTVPDGVLEPVLERIRLESLGSPEFYRSAAEELGLSGSEFIDLSDNLTMHYQRVFEELTSRGDEMRERCGAEYVDRMLSGLARWVEAGRSGHLCWGIHRFEKPGD